MKINKSKSKILVCSRKEAAKPNIKYITNDGGCAKEIKYRLQQARYAFQKKKRLTYFEKYRLKNKEKPTEDIRLERGTLWQ